MKTVRVPARIMFYISGGGWYQHPTCEDNLGRQHLRELLNAARPNSDGSLTVPAEPTVLVNLRTDAKHLLDATRWGDHTMDDLADANAARAMLRRIEALEG